MKLNNVRAAITATLTIDNNDIEVLSLLSQGSYPVAEWICETYHVPSRMDKERIERTLKKISSVMYAIKEEKKKVEETEIRVS